MFVNATKVYQFKAKNSEIKDYAMFLANILKDFTIIKKKKKKTKRSCKMFSVDFNPNDINNVLGIHNYLM